LARRAFSCAPLQTSEVRAARSDDTAKHKIPTHQSGIVGIGIAIVALVRVRCAGKDAGLWRISGKRQMVYASKELSDAEKSKAARALIAAVEAQPVIPDAVGDFPGDAVDEFAEADIGREVGMSE
jgi:hypothetical protein